MPPKSQLTFLNQPAGSPTLVSTEFGEPENPLYQFGTPSEKFGAKQETASSGTTFGGEAARPPMRVPRSVELPRSLAPAGRPGATLVTRQLWEGTVTEIKEDGFI